VKVTSLISLPTNVTNIIAYSIQCTLDPWRTVLDGAVFLLLVIAIALSIRITASSTSSSICKTMEAPVAVQVLIELLPPCLIVVVLYASYFARYALGAPQRAALALFQMVLGVVLAEWLAICACGVSSGPATAFVSIRWLRRG
jgi:hypothetical protein